MKKSGQDSAFPWSHSSWLPLVMKIPCSGNSSWLTRHIHFGNSCLSQLFSEGLPECQMHFFGNSCVTHPIASEWKVLKLRCVFMRAQSPYQAPSKRSPKNTKSLSSLRTQNVQNPPVAGHLQLLRGLEPRTSTSTYSSHAKPFTCPFLMSPCQSGETTHKKNQICQFSASSWSFLSSSAGATSLIVLGVSLCQSQWKMPWTFLPTLPPWALYLIRHSWRVGWGHLQEHVPRHARLWTHPRCQKCCAKKNSFFPSRLKLPVRN